MEGDSIRCVTLKKIYKKKRKHNLGERIGGCIVKIKEKKNEQRQPGQQTTCSQKKNRKIENKRKRVHNLGERIGGCAILVY